jgi:uncharacterized glyoxalase superfamily protein PhnB
MVSFFSVNGSRNRSAWAPHAMNGDARRFDGPDAFAAALDGAAVRLKDLLLRLKDLLLRPKVPLLGVKVPLLRLKGLALARLQPAQPVVQPIPQGASVRTSVIPTVRYRDVPAAVAWLCRAFGMQVHRVVTDADGAPRYAELTVGGGMLMVAPIEDTPFGKLMVQPDEIGGVETQVCYLCVANARAHYRRARAAGAVIVLEPDDEANRGRGYSCRDPEGHVWNFGTYDPWAGQSPPPPPARWRPGRLGQGLVTLLLLAVASVLLSEAAPQPSARAGTAALAAAPAAVSFPVAGERLPGTAQAPAQPVTSDRAFVPITARLHRAALQAAERTAAEARMQLAEARGALEKAEREATAARSQLEEVQHARQAAERAAEDARTRLAAVQKDADRAREATVRERAQERARAARAAVEARRRAAVNAMRLRQRWSRALCYSQNAPSQTWTGPGRLIGFCKS